MDYQKTGELLLKLKSAYESIGAETELVIEEPAGITEVEEIENKLERKLPVQIREFFLQFSGNCRFSAYLPDDFELPEELESIFSAEFLISLEELTCAEDRRKDWVEECFTDEEDEYNAVWHHKLGFMSVPNGDIIAFDIKESETNPPVVYLSHDDGDGHGYILGKDFNSYFEQLLLVGACGSEDWQILPFCSDARSGIISDCENAKEYRRLIGLQI
ncbi:MAG: SMI1/KNR4 family protein [Lachnospiraceae bacterium]|nr:SMI1/KNR4 family protein [Lachnospiraceae bacterium]